MTNYREILRFNAQGISHRSIVLGCECSRNTVSKLIARAKEHNVQWPLSSDISDLEPEKKLVPEKSGDEPSRKYPDYEYIDKEMMWNGVTLFGIAPLPFLDIPPGLQYAPTRSHLKYTVIGRAIVVDYSIRDTFFLKHSFKYICFKFIIYFYPANFHNHKPLQKNIFD
jgi:hypothetical protein